VKPIRSSHTKRCPPAGGHLGISAQGGTRRYSDADIARVRLVARLQEQGVNLTGVGRVIELQEENDALRRRLDRKR